MTMVSMASRQFSIVAVGRSASRSALFTSFTSLVPAACISEAAGMWFIQLLMWHMGGVCIMSVRKTSHVWGEGADLSVLILVGPDHEGKNPVDHRADKSARVGVSKMSQASVLQNDCGFDISIVHGMGRYM